MATERDLGRLLAGLAPERVPGVWVFAVARDGAAPPGAVVTLREPEGLTVVLAEAEAAAQGLAPRFRAAWIALGVQSDLAAVGLTAAVAGALARAGIACNVIAGVHHDHLFVPVEAAGTALACLGALSRGD